MARTDRAVNTRIVRLRVKWREHAPPGEKAASNWTTVSLDGALVDVLADLNMSAKHYAEAILCSLHMQAITDGPADTSLSRYVQAYLIRKLGHMAKAAQHPDRPAPVADLLID